MDQWVLLKNGKDDKWQKLEIDKNMNLEVSEFWTPCDVWWWMFAIIVVKKWYVGL